MSVFDKKAVVEEMIKDGYVLIQVAVQAPGVIVPDVLWGQEIVGFEIGFDMPIQIPDLDIGEEGIVGTLSFERVSMKCFFPWDAIIAAVIRDKLHVAWLPTEVEDQVPMPRSAKPKLTVVR